MYTTMEQAQEVWTTYTKELADLNEEIKVLKQRNNELEAMFSTFGNIINACCDEVIS